MCELQDSPVYRGEHRIEGLSHGKRKVRVLRRPCAASVQILHVVLRQYQYIISSRRRSAGKADSIYRHTANGQKPKHAAGTERLFFKRAELLYTTDRPRPCCLSCLLRRGFLIKNVINVTNGPSEERPLRTGAWWSSLISCIHDKS